MTGVQTCALPIYVNTTSSIAKLPEKEPEMVTVAEVVSAKTNSQASSSFAKTVPAQVTMAKSEDTRAVEAKAEAKPRSVAGWVIQLGATDDEGKARDILSRAKTKGGPALSDASAFTEKVEKGNTTLFRARFAGFDDSKDAETACKTLKRGGFACFAVKG